MSDNVKPIVTDFYKVGNHSTIEQSIKFGEHLNTMSGCTKKEGTHIFDDMDRELNEIIADSQPVSVKTQCKFLKTNKSIWINNIFLILQLRQTLIENNKRFGVFNTEDHLSFMLLELDDNQRIKSFSRYHSLKLSTSYLGKILLFENIHLPYDCVSDVVIECFLKTISQKIN